MAETWKLTGETIDLLSEKLSELYISCGVGSKEVTRARLLLEEALLKYQSHFGEEIELSYRKYKIFGQHRFIVKIKAPSFDPFTLEENPMAFMIESVMSSFENGLPSWKYANLENELVFTLHQQAKRSGLTQLALACVVSIGLSIPVRLWGGSGLASFVSSYLDPLADAYAGLFCIMAVLLTFFAITLSIIHIGDMSTAGSAGGKILRRYALMSILLTGALSLPVLPFFEIGDAGGLSFAAKSVYDVLIGFIPSNLVSPFLNFNSMHIMIIGVMFGFSLLSLGDKSQNLVTLFEECNRVACTTNGFLNRFIHFYVGFKVFTLLSTSDFSSLKGAGRLVILIVGAELLLFAFYTLTVCLRNHISFSEYFRAMLPFFMVCLSSANFGASFSTIVNGLIALNAFDEQANIALGLGSVLFRPSCTLVFFFSSLFMASFFGMEISAVWVLTAAALSLLLVAAVPNIPGVSVSVITLLFTQLGLPNEAVAMMIAIYAPLQFLTVAVDTWCLGGECVNISRKASAGAK